MKPNEETDHRDRENNNNKLIKPEATTQINKTITAKSKMFETLVDSFLEWEIDQIVLVQKVWVFTIQTSKNPISYSI